MALTAMLRQERSCFGDSSLPPGLTRLLFSKAGYRKIRTENRWLRKRGHVTPTLRAFQEIQGIHKPLPTYRYRSGAWMKTHTL